MTKQEAYEKLDLPAGSDLQLVRQKFQRMHNEYQVLIDVAFNNVMRLRMEQQLEELKEAYALLNRTAKKSVDTWFMLKEGAYVQAMLFIVPEFKKIQLKTDIHINSQTVELANNLLYIAGEVSVAQSSSDVKNIIASYAMPVASYKAKRTYSKSLMLTTYAGIGFNYYAKDKKNELMPVIIAPTGLEYSRRCGDSKSFSIMASVIDIGNVINYRLLGKGNDSVNVARFDRILSPGLHLSYGFSKKLPFAINVGYQFNPNRFSIGAFVDLPLFTLWKRE